MRAWTIVLFILAIHVCLSMFNAANIMDIGVNVTLDTSSKNGITVSPGNTNINMPSSTIFNASPSTSEDVLVNKSLVIQQSDFISNMIQTIFGVADSFFKLMGTFSTVVFSIHYLAAPYFGDTNAWYLEGIVDFVFSISLFQMVTGRSFKTME